MANMLLLCYLIDFLYLNGGPSYQYTALSSPPKTNLNGLFNLIAHVFNVSATPLNSPTLLPLSKSIAFPKYVFPSPTIANLSPSPVQHMSFIAPPNTSSYYLNTG